jgi:hypothetical protein
MGKLPVSGPIAEPGPRSGEWWAGPAGWTGGLMPPANHMSSDDNHPSAKVESQETEDLVRRCW